MNKFITLLLIFATILITTNLSAQIKTPYQKKTEALSIQLLKDLGVNPATIKRYTEAGEIGGFFFLGNISQKLQTERGMLAFFKYQQEIKKAEKLKNNIDFKRDADKKAIEERKKEVELVKQQERQKQQKIIDQEDKRKRNFENSDYVKIGNEIKFKFEEWSKKGEFEKTSDFENRIINESEHQFSKICFNEINRRTNFNSKNIELKNYDADKEFYTISITNKYNYGEDEDEDEFIGKLQIPLSNAKKFKNDFDSYEPVAEVGNWTFSNYNIVPSIITFLPIEKEASEKTPSYTVNFSINNEMPIIYSTTDLKINIPKLPLISFNYNIQAPIIIQKEKQKKLEDENAKQKKLEEQKKSEQEALFSHLINRVDNIFNADKFKDKKPKEISKSDLIAFSTYNVKRIELYSEALKIKNDEDIKNKLTECQMFEKEIQERKLKIEKTNRLINGLLRY